jgi:hypothetical protein
MKTLSIALACMVLLAATTADAKKSHIKHAAVVVTEQSVRPAGTNTGAILHQTQGGMYVKGVSPYE